MDKGSLIVIIGICVLIGLLMLQWLIAVIKYLLIPLWKKYKENIIVGFYGLLGIAGFLLFIIISMHNCSRSNNREMLDEEEQEWVEEGQRRGVPSRYWD